MKHNNRRVAEKMEVSQRRSALTLLAHVLCGEKLLLNVAKDLLVK